MIMKTFIHRFRRLILIVAAAPIILVVSVYLKGESYNLWETNPVEIIVENGAKVLFEKDASSSLTVIQFFFKGGKLAEPQNKEGLSYITTRLVLEIPDRQKAQDFMLQATKFRMHSENDYSVVVVSCLSEKLEESLSLISKIMLNPIFSTIRIKNIKENMLNRKKIEQDINRNIAFQNIMNTLFQNTKYQGSVYGSEESLKKINRKDIVDFYEKYFTAGNTVISVSSDLDQKAIINHLNQYFSQLRKGSGFVQTEFALSPIETKSVHITRETKQTLISFGYRLPQIDQKNFVLSMMFENLLGNGIDSKLWPLRKEKMLAYNVSADVSHFKYGGMLEVLLETENSKKDKALEALNVVLEKLYTEGIQLEDLDTAKVFTKSSFLRSNETKRARTATRAFLAVMNLEFDSFENIFTEIDSIKLEEMNSYIQKILDKKNRMIVTIGPE